MIGALALLSALFGVFPAIALAHTWGLPIAGGAAMPVDQSPGEQTDPHIGGPLVAYTSDLNGSSELRAHNLLTGVRTIIPTLMKMRRISWLT